MANAIILATGPVSSVLAPAVLTLFFFCNYSYQLAFSHPIGKGFRPCGVVHDRDINAAKVRCFGAYQISPKRTERLKCAKTGSPKSRETHGAGVSILLKRSG